jgi:hypothetical protein
MKTVLVTGANQVGSTSQFIAPSPFQQVNGVIEEGQRHFVVAGEARCRARLRNSHRISSLGRIWIGRRTASRHREPGTTRLGRSGRGIIAGAVEPSMIVRERHVSAGLFFLRSTGI